MDLVLRKDDARVGQRGSHWPKLDILGHEYSPLNPPAQRTLGSGYFCLVPLGVDVSVKLEGEQDEQENRRRNTRTAAADYNTSAPDSD